MSSNSPQTVNPTSNENSFKRKSVKELIMENENRIKKFKEIQNEEDRRRAILEQNKLRYKNKIRKIREEIQNAKDSSTKNKLYQDNLEFFQVLGVDNPNKMENEIQQFQYLIDQYDNDLNENPEEDEEEEEEEEENIEENNNNNLLQTSEQISYTGPLNNNISKYSSSYDKNCIEIQRPLNETNLERISFIGKRSDIATSKERISFLGEKPKIKKYTIEPQSSYDITNNNIKKYDRDVQPEEKESFSLNKQKHKFKELITDSNEQTTFVSNKKYENLEILNKVNNFYIPPSMTKFNQRINNEQLTINNNIVTIDINDNNINNNDLINNFLKEKKNNINYEKNIISSLEEMIVLHYEIGDCIIPFDPCFLDVLCTNCYECVKYEDMDSHSEKCVIKIKEFQDNKYEDDYNTQLYKLYQSLKNKENSIKKSNNPDLISFFNNLLAQTYSVVINNNSIEELNTSVSNILSSFKDYDQKHTFTQNYKVYFSITYQRISQLIYKKLNAMQYTLEENDDDYDEDDFDFEKQPENIEHINYMKNQLSDLQTKTQKANDQLIEWKKQAKILENNLKKPNNKIQQKINDINSDINSRSDNNDVMSLLTAQISDLPDYNNHGVDINFDDFNDEDKKKYFINLALEYKFKFPEKYNTENALADMYEKAKYLNINPNNYNEFILNEFNCLK